MPLSFSTQKVVEVQEWDRLVSETYGKVYNFQQQNGCRDRGVVHLTVPDRSCDFENDSVPEKINGTEMGVSFESWKDRDPKEPVGERQEQWEIDLFWQRNFYPDIQTVANDLYEKGQLERGTYVINIDW